MRPLPLLFLQRGSEQAGSALSSVGGSGISDAIAYATEELGRALAAARSASALGVAGALPGAAAAAESLSLARGALQVRKAGGWGATPDSHPPFSCHTHLPRPFLIAWDRSLASAQLPRRHRAGGLGRLALMRRCRPRGVPLGRSLHCTRQASPLRYPRRDSVVSRLTLPPPAVTQAAVAVTRAAADASGAVSRATAATSSDAVAAGSRAALSAALSLADRGVSLAVSTAAHFDRQHHIVERLQVGSGGAKALTGSRVRVIAIQVYPGRPSLPRRRSAKATASPSAWRLQPTWRRA